MGWEKKDFRLEERELDWELGKNGNLGRKILQGKTWEWGSRKILGWEGEEVSGWKRILIGNLGGIPPWDSGEGLEGISQGNSRIPHPWKCPRLGGSNPGSWEGNGMSFEVPSSQTIPGFSRRIPKLPSSLPGIWEGGVGIFSMEN